MKTAAIVAIGFAMLALADFAFAVDAEDAVGAWLFDEGKGDKAIDSSGNGNDGEIANCEYVAGKFGRALEFSGNQSVVTVEDSDTLDLEDAVTMVAWVDYEGSTVAWPNIIAKGADVTPENYALFVSSGDALVHFPATPGGGRSWLNSEPGSIQLQGWQHVAGTYGDGERKLYVNGKEIAEEQKSGALQVNDMVVRIGDGGSIGQGYWWGGLMDDVAVFDVALDEEEINEIMNRGLSAVFDVAPKGKLALSWASLKHGR